MSNEQHDWGGGDPRTPPTYSSRQAAKLAGVPFHTLQSWMERGHLLGPKFVVEKNRAAGGTRKGAMLRFSWRALVELSLGFEILRSSGGDARGAFYAAAQFAYSSQGELLDPKRVAGLPYPRRWNGRTIGDTYFCRFDDRVLVTADEGRRRFPHFILRGLDTTSCVMIAAEPVVRRVCDRAGEDFDMVMARAYAAPELTA